MPSPARGSRRCCTGWRPEFVSENGLTRIPADDQYVYTTTSPLVAPPGQPSPDIPQRDGSLLPICQVDNDPGSTSQIAPDVRQHEPAGHMEHRVRLRTRTPPAACRRRPGRRTSPGTSRSWSRRSTRRRKRKLDGLDHAITSGNVPCRSRPARSATPPPSRTRRAAKSAAAPMCSLLPQPVPGAPGTRCQWTSVPVLAADASPMQEALQVTEYRMPQSAAALVGAGAAARRSPRRCPAGPRRSGQAA